MKENMENLLNFLYGEQLEKDIQLKEYVDSIDVSERKPIIDREEEVKTVIKVEGLDLDPNEVLKKVEEIEQNIMGLISVDTKYLLLQEILEVDELVYDLDKYKSYYHLGKRIYDDLNKEKHIYCYNPQIQKYESLEFDLGDYDKLKNLNIIKKLYEKDGWIYKLYYLNEDLQLRPLDNYLLENEDYTMVCVCRDGNILNLKRDNWILVKHPLLRKEYLEEIESAKKVGQWLKDNYGGENGQDKLEKEIMQEAEKKAKEIEELLEVAEEIIENEGEDE